MELLQSMNDYKEIFLDPRIASFWSVSARLEYLMAGRLGVGPGRHQRGLIMTLTYYSLLPLTALEVPRLQSESGGGFSFTLDSVFGVNVQSNLSIRFLYNYKT